MKIHIVTGRLPYVQFLRAVYAGSTAAENAARH